MASKGMGSGNKKDNGMDFLKNLKLENKSRAYNSSNKSSFIDGSDTKESNVNRQEDYANHLLEH